MHERASERIEYINTDGTTDKSFFDLSATGICCHFHRPLAQNAAVSIKIGDLTLKARVVYCTERTDGFRLGLQFSEVSADQQKKLTESIEKFSRGVMLSCAIVDAPKSPS
jgi:c-di-GMP-binding flagellar brake protein YcgR